MKKIITLMFCTALLSSAFAQKDDRDWNRDNDQRIYRDAHERPDKYGRYDHKNNNNRTVYHDNRYSTYQRDRLIQRVSRQYDYKIQEVSHSRYLSRREKKRAIKTLKAQKAQAVQRIYNEYNNSNVYNDRDAWKKYKKYKHHNDY